MWIGTRWRGIRKKLTYAVVCGAFGFCQRRGAVRGTALLSGGCSFSIVPSSVLSKLLVKRSKLHEINSDKSTK